MAEIFSLPVKVEKLTKLWDLALAPALALGLGSRFVLEVDEEGDWEDDAISVVIPGVADLGCENLSKVPSRA